MAGWPKPRAGEAPDWKRLESEKRRILSRADETVENRLRRGQRLSAQAAALRRAVRHERTDGA